MSLLTHVPVSVFPPDRFRSVLAPEQYERFREAAARGGELLQGRVVCNVNSTAKGGGVAEMLPPLLAHARGAGVDATWAVIQGNERFFRVTKRIHNHLHGSAGDEGPLGDEEREVYERTLAANAEELCVRLGEGDVVILHDPQTAGLTRPMKEAGAIVIWRCHVGLDFPNDIAREAWKFLIPYVEPADAYIFSREAFAWEGLDTGKVHIVPPSIDAFSPKNQAMDEATMQAILDAGALVSGGSSRAAPTFTRHDGSPGRVDRPAEMYDDAKRPPAGARLVVQVSRWDRLKDPLGVIEGFDRHIARRCDAHLIVAGPAVQAVADDPEGLDVLNEARARWDQLSGDVKERVHLACLPMYDGEENAAIVNALQRRADVVVQKSLAEGFGLTVAEAMWKARPVVATKIGGIQDQIVDGETGVLIEQPSDLGAFGEAVLGLLQDAGRARAMGQKAQERVRSNYLGPRHLMQYLDLIERLVA